MSGEGLDSLLHIYPLAHLAEKQSAREPLFPNADGDIESYRMNTEHFNGYVVHEEELSSGFRRKSTWDLKGEIERGSAGGVYLQRECERGTLRAVKAVQPPKEGSQELKALIDLI